MKDRKIVATDAELEALCGRLESASAVAFDTEFVPEYTFAPDLCLVQVAAEDVLVAVDPYSVGDLKKFWRILTDPAREVVVHAGKEEMNFCQEYAGRLPQKLIDVQLAAGLVGMGYPLSLDNLLQKTVKGNKLKKTETRTDWRKRPLTMTQVDYALDDVRYLLQVRAKLGEKLEKLGRMHWLEEETKRFLATTARRSDDRWTRVSGAGGLRGLDLAVFRELVNWRDDRAKRVNKPARWVLRDDLLAELAKRQPKTIKELQAMRGAGNVANSEAGAEIVEAVERGLGLPTENWPARPKRRDPVEEQMVVKILSAALIHVAQEADVAPSLLGGNDDLKDFVNFVLDKDDSTPPPKLAQGWRKEVCADYLTDLIHGKVHLRISAKGGKLALAFEDRKG
jgi:ribonuclease D